MARSRFVTGMSVQQMVFLLMAVTFSKNNGSAIPFLNCSPGPRLLHRLDESRRGRSELFPVLVFQNIPSDEARSGGERDAARMDKARGSLDGDAAGRDDSQHRQRREDVL